MTQPSVEIARIINPDDSRFGGLAKLFTRRFGEVWKEEHNPRQIEEFFRTQQQELGHNSVFMCAMAPDNQILGFTRLARVTRKSGGVVGMICSEAEKLSNVSLPKVDLQERASIYTGPGSHDGYFGDIVVDSGRVRELGLPPFTFPLIVESYKKLYNQGLVATQGIFTSKVVDPLIGSLATRLGGERIYPNEADGDAVGNPLIVYVARGDTVFKRIQSLSR